MKILTHLLMLTFTFEYFIFCWVYTVSVIWTYGCEEMKALTFLNFSISQHVVVTRASCEGSEDPGRGGHVSDRTESPGTLAEKELLQWWPSLLHGDPTKCDWHLQKSNLHPSSRRRAGERSVSVFWQRPLIYLFFFLCNSETDNSLKKYIPRGSSVFCSIGFA